MWNSGTDNRYSRANRLTDEEWEEELERKFEAEMEQLKKPRDNADELYEWKETFRSILTRSPLDAVEALEQCQFMAHSRLIRAIHDARESLGE